MTDTPYMTPEALAEIIATRDEIAAQLKLVETGALFILPPDFAEKLRARLAEYDEIIRTYRRH